jgi:hypothetical protein
MPSPIVHPAGNATKNVRETALNFFCFAPFVDFLALDGYAEKLSENEAVAGQLEFGAIVVAAKGSCVGKKKLYVNCENATTCLRFTLKGR